MKKKLYYIIFNKEILAFCIYIIFKIKESEIFNYLIIKINIGLIQKLSLILLLFVEDIITIF